MPSTVAMYSASGMRGMPEFVEMALGPLAMRRAFSDAGLPEDTQMREGAHIPEAALVAFLDSAARQSGDAALGALLGTHVDIRRYGSWGQYVLEGETLGASLMRFVKSYDCLFSYCGVFLETEGDLTWFSHTYASRGTDGYLQTALASPGAMINIMRHYAGPSFWPTMVHLDIPKPARTTDIEAHLPFDIIYDAPRFGIAFPRHLLSFRRIAGRPEAPISLSEVRRRTSPARAQTVLDAVAETVRLQIGSGRPSLDATARMLGMNTRTLRRAMDREGVTYRELSRRMMLDTARELLVETDMPLSYVAQAAGYADQFSFSRAYYEAYGQRPSWLRQSA